MGHITETLRLLQQEAGDYEYPNHPILTANLQILLDICKHPKPLTISISQQCPVCGGWVTLTSKSHTGAGARANGRGDREELPRRGGK